MEACTLDGYPVAGLARHLQIKWLNTLIVDDGSVYLGIGDTPTTPHPIESNGMSLKHIEVVAVLSVFRNLNPILGCDFSCLDQGNVDNKKIPRQSVCRHLKVPLLLLLSGVSRKMPKTHRSNWMKHLLPVGSRLILWGFFGFPPLAA